MSPKSQNLISLEQLYERDFNLWVEQTIVAIKQGDFQAIDWQNLLEEIEDINASQKRALRSFTQRLIEHIFKLMYWESEKQRNENGWKQEVMSFRREIRNILEDSPSLKNYLAENYLVWYAKSLK